MSADVADTVVDSATTWQCVRSVQPLQNQRKALVVDNVKRLFVDAAHKCHGAMNRLTMFFGHKGYQRRLLSFGFVMFLLCLPVLLFVIPLVVIDAVRGTLKQKMHSRRNKQRAQTYAAMLNAHLTFWAPIDLWFSRTREKKCPDQRTFTQLVALFLQNRGRCLRFRWLNLFAERREVAVLVELFFFLHFCLFVRFLFLFRSATSAAVLSLHHNEVHNGSRENRGGFPVFTGFQKSFPVSSFFETGGRLTV